MNARLPLLGVALITGISLPLGLEAAGSRLLPFQGRLTDATGTPLPDGARLVQFQIFGEPTGGTPLWAGEVHRLTINGGLVNVMLGSRNPLPNDRADDPARSFFDATLYLQVTPDANADEKLTDADPPLLPRQAIVPVVFAQESATARTVSDRAITASKIADAAVQDRHIGTLSHLGASDGDPASVVVVDAEGQVGVGTPNPRATLDVGGRILRNGQEFAKAGTVSDGQVVTVPWGSIQDWEIFIAPRQMGLEESPASWERDNALLMIVCSATPTGDTGWTVTARFKFKWGEGSIGWAGGTANYLLVPR